MAHGQQPSCSSQSRRGPRKDEELTTTPKRSAIRQLDQELHHRVGDLALHLNANREGTQMQGLGHRTLTTSGSRFWIAAQALPLLHGGPCPARRHLFRCRSHPDRAGSTPGWPLGGPAGLPRASSARLPNESGLDVYRIKKAKEAKKHHGPDTLPQAEAWESPASSKEKAPSSPWAKLPLPSGTIN